LICPHSAYTRHLEVRNPGGNDFIGERGGTRTRDPMIKDHGTVRQRPRAPPSPVTPPRDATAKAIATKRFPNGPYHPHPPREFPADGFFI